jgi:single-strand DNA-binding protein
MVGETTLTIVGNLTADPELRFTPAGHAVADFTVASTPRNYDRQTGQWRDGEALFLRCTAWRQLAEHTAESLTKGTRVIVTGRLRQRSFELTEGVTRTVTELEVDDLGPSLRHCTARVTKTTRTTTPASSTTSEPTTTPVPTTPTAGGTGGRVSA